MSKRLEDYEASYVRNFLEDNWYEFVEKLTENYDEDAEAIAEDIVNKLT